MNSPGNSGSSFNTRTKEVVLAMLFGRHGFFFSRDFFTAFLDALAHFLQSFAGPGRRSFDTLAGKFFVFSDVGFKCCFDCVMIAHSCSLG